MWLRHCFASFASPPSMASPNSAKLDPHTARLVNLLKVVRDPAVRPHLADRALQGQLAEGSFQTCPNALPHRARCDAILGWMPPAENVNSTDLQWSCNTCLVAAFGGQHMEHGTPYADGEAHLAGGELHDEPSLKALLALAPSGRGASLKT